MQLCHDGLKKISSDHSFFFCIWLTKTSNQIDKKTKTIHISKTNNSDKIIISLLGTEFSDMSPFSFILLFIIRTVILGIPNGCLDAYEVKVNIDISKYQEKVKLISQFQRFFSFFNSLLEFTSLPFI